MQHQLRKKHEKDWLFLPLGGSGEIGMNLNCYQLDGKWIIVDFGAGFGDETLPGIDLIVPDIAFIKQNLKDFLGIILTHAHEDHIGALPYLWKQLKLPIYATPFTAEMVRLKMAETELMKEVKIHTVQPGSFFEVGPFVMQMVQLTHSIPEMNAFVIKTRLGTILHTGDWKFDDNPLVGPASDYAALKKFGDEGVLAMVCDSTNVLNPRSSGSESALYQNLLDIVKESNRMVVITTFASNIARVETISKVAQAAGRKVVVLGRSLWRITQAARDTGYLKDTPEFLTDEEAELHPREKLLVLCTGCQGEERAAMTRLAYDDYRYIKLKPGDRIIFSSKIIPGNEKKIFRLFNMLVQKGVDLFTEKDHLVHVSGHPGQEELKEMYRLVRPQVAIPVHGERVHLHEHCKFARAHGVKKALEIANGDVIKLAPGETEKVAVMPAGFYGVDGNYLVHPDSEIMRTRRSMQTSGYFHVAIVMNQRSQIMAPPKISAPGLLDKQDDKETLKELSEELHELLRHQGKAGDTEVEKVTKQFLRRNCKQDFGKFPMIEVAILRI